MVPEQLPPVEFMAQVHAVQSRESLNEAYITVFTVYGAPGHATSPAS
jgi:hypothetical protein